ncbi:2-oxoglutarate dehydrogenase complex E2 component [Teratosphaeriaceae sp. CCFEE 6253]|nr:2-oxoglutarate dehydrogenase complex E2 component [Teratosphaeriaceae sp. CCFEE 6253]
MSSPCLRRLAVTGSRPSSLLLRQVPRSSASSFRCLSTFTSTSRSSLALLRQQKAVLPTQTRLFSLRARQNEEKIVKVPDMAESITEGTLKQFSVQPGDYVEQDQEIATIETDKIDVAVNAPTAGTIKEFLAKEEDTVTVGQDLVKMDLGGEPGQTAEKGKDEPKSPASDSQETSSQPDGQKEESKPAPSPPKQESKPNPPKQDSKPAPAPPQAEKKPDKKNDPSINKPQDVKPPVDLPYGTREERRVKMNRMRLRIAERLKQSQNTAASLTTFNEVDMSALMDMRKRYKDEVLKSTGVKLGFMSAFAKASILAMREIPAVNASIEGPGSGDTVVYRDYVDVSVAVATEKGLVTPVVRNAESLDMIGIEREIAALGKKAQARDNKLTIEDMAGGTFTISNGGVFGSLMGTPIINLPQTAVLGLHAIKEKPVAINGQVVIRPMMYLALTYDHRLLDGREAVTFLVKIKELIEDPRKMLLV